MRWVPTALCVCGALLGCGDPSGPGPAVREAERAPAPPPPPMGAGAAMDEAAGAEVERPAEVGVGRKGHGYGTGPVATPLAARWRAAERIVFDIQIPHAMNLFKAEHGRAPGSHEEFMKEIIDPNRIALPELRDAERYQYDPATEQLMVVGPTAQ